MTTKLFVSSEELVALTNYLTDKKYEIFTYFLESPIFEIIPVGTCNFKLSVLFKQNEFLEILKCRENETYAEYFVPKPNEFKRKIFISSGIIGYQNIDQIERILNEISNLDFIYKGELAPVFFLDSSLHYDRFFTLYFMPKIKVGKSQHRTLNVRFLFLERIRSELIEGKQIKIPYEARKFIKKLNVGKFPHITRWVNSFAYKTRMAYLALCDFLQIEKLGLHIKNGDDTSVHGTGDVAHCKAIQKFVSNRKFKVYVFSADKDFEPLLRGRENIELINLKRERIKFNQRNIKIDCNKLAEFLYVTSVHLGAMSIVSESGEVYLYGNWEGKELGDFLESKVKLFVMPSKRVPPFWDELAKDLQVLETMKKENFDYASRS